MLILWNVQWKYRTFDKRRKTLQLCLTMKYQEIDQLYHRMTLQNIYKEKERKREKRRKERNEIFFKIVYCIHIDPDNLIFQHIFSISSNGMFDSMCADTAILELLNHMPEINSFCLLFFNNNKKKKRKRFQYFNTYWNITYLLNPTNRVPHRYDIWPWLIVENTCSMLWYFHHLHCNDTTTTRKKEEKKQKLNPQHAYIRAIKEVWENHWRSIIITQIVTFIYVQIEYLFLHAATTALITIRIPNTYIHSQILVQLHFTIGKYYWKCWTFTVSLNTHF